MPGCAVGAHTLRKPAKVENAPAASVSVPVVPAIPLSLEAKARGDGAVAREACARCSAGFYCSEHAGHSDDAATKHAGGRTLEEPSSSIPPVVVDDDTVQTCKRPGCGEKYRERDNADDACVHHSGAPIFHEGKKGWSCCGKLVYDFDDFLKLAPCARGRHDATWTLEFQKHTDKKAK
jgi:disease resistance protein